MYTNMYGFLPPAPPCAHDSMVDTRDNYSALFISTQNCVLCSSLAWIRGEVDCGYRFRRLFVPLLFPHFYHAIRSRSTISICIYILLLVWACCCLIAISSFIFHTFHGTGRLILTYSNNYLYVRVAGNIPCILTQGAIQFCSSKLFSCFAQPSVLTA
jgi:hypothetical protein